MKKLAGLKTKLIAIGVALSILLGVYIVLLASLTAQAIISEAAIQESKKQENVVVLSPEVEKWRAAVSQELSKYGQEQWTQLVLCIIQQESGGTCLDVMQCSESIGLPPNSITDPLYSIEIGCRYFIGCLTAAEPANPQDIQGIRLLLQGYNFGNGYIAYAKALGGWTQQNVFDFAEVHSGGIARTGTAAQNMGPWGYGDQYYSDHVLKYYTSSGSGGGSALGDDKFALVKAEAEKYIGWPYVWGGASPETSFDCSGFVSWVYNSTGITDYGRLTAQGWYDHCTPVSQEEAKPGDLVFFVNTYPTSEISHIGIYMGDNTMLHCGDPIGYADISNSYWSGHLYGFGRV